MTKTAIPNVLVLTGYGINCDEETKFAFDKSGANANIIHINDLISNLSMLNNYQIFAFPGGFSYGDDTGSGMALANKVRNNMWDELQNFVHNDDHLMIGICNGFQVMTNLGLLPAMNGNYNQQVALTHNDSARYLDRWVDLEFSGIGPWVKDVGTISVPIAHGEGKFYADNKTIMRINEKNLIAAKYVDGDICKYQMLDPNPNGSIEDIASITDESGRIIGMMPHPERAIDFTHLPNWTLLKEKYKRAHKEIPNEGPGLKIFRNAVEYYK